MKLKFLLGNFEKMAKNSYFWQKNMKNGHFQVFFFNQKFVKENLKPYHHKLLETIFNPAQTAPLYLYSFRNESNSQRTCECPNMTKTTCLLGRGSNTQNHVFLDAAQGLHPADVWSLPTKFQVIWVTRNWYRHTPPHSNSA